MKALKFITPVVALFFLAATTAAFVLGVRRLAFAAGLQLVPAILANAWVVLAAIAAITLLFGRFFCRAMCPLGILQSVANRIFHPRTAVRRVCTRLPETGAQRAVRWTVLAAAAACIALGFGAWAGMLDPYAIYGRVLSLLPPCDGEAAAPVHWPFAAVSAGMFAAIIAAAAVGKGRFWCNWICPAGTVFNLVARFAWKKDAVAGGCGNCRRCFPKPAEKATGAETAADDGVTRRDAIRTMAAAAAGEKLTDGGFAEVSLPGVPERKLSVLPPGAGRREDFFRKCVACQLCVKSCPMHCLAPSASLSRFGQPEMDFRAGHCHIDCTRCSEVCPAGAIARLSKEEKRTAHVGRAVWRKDACLRTTDDVECTACERKCPVKAIHVVNGVPVVDAEACLGCGACEHVCPARPTPAIAVEGLEAQRWTDPSKETAFVGPPSPLDAALARMARDNDAW
ncbi:MAG: 4Fe-4S binding protein [Kiritimatiellae bacterium]|nr:4Fe-4S binding protein [Kiritimatiellia bacterium]